MSIGEFRANLAEALSRAAYGGERIVISKKGKPLVAVVSMSDLRLLEDLEDRQDVTGAELALCEGKFLPFEQAIEEIGLGDSGMALTA